VNISSRTAKGLILSRQWQDGSDGQKLVFWLATSSGPARIEIREEESIFFIAASDRQRASSCLDRQLKWRSTEIDLRCFHSREPALACYFRNQSGVRLGRSLLQQNDIPVYEADVRPTDRYLMERFIRGTLEVTG
ncbi:uncharacterized protein METZ01_LOCUS363081, partial [marine metagenome]